MSKRKASEALGGLPSTLVQEPAGTSGTGPFTVHFPSRFDPTGDVACEWDAYAHSERRNQYVVVARTVSILMLALRCTPQPNRLRRHSQAHRRHFGNLLLPLLQKSEVDFVGSTSNPEYSSALPCRQGLSLQRRCAPLRAAGSRFCRCRRFAACPAAKVRRRSPPVDLL
jgi:hypothetical protein